MLALLAEGLRAGGFAPVAAAPFAALAPEAVRTMLADTVVTADDFVVQVPLEPTADGLGRRLVSVLVPVRLFTPFLSPFGAAVHGAVAAGEPFQVADAPAAADPIDCTLVACASITFDDGPTSFTDGSHRPPPRLACARDALPAGRERRAAARGREPARGRGPRTR